MPSSQPKFPHVPPHFYDSKERIHYDLGKYLGKGGFAKVYGFQEIIKSKKSKRNESVTGRPSRGSKSEQAGTLFAGKLVPLNLLVKSNQKEKMKNEINLHQLLQHKNIVQFVHNFQTVDFVVIVMELCTRNSLMELSKRRKTLLEPEVRYYMKYLAEGVKYIHSHKIIHRDLKLSNVFLDEYLNVKIGDFGLAVECDDDDPRTTICGTPNYLAPEILEKEGHNYPVDVWAMGVILFTLLNGKPPFETNSIQTTYERIKKVSFHMPTTISTEAKHLINEMLQRSPHSRPKVRHLKNVRYSYYDNHGVKKQTFNWFSLWTPDSLPISSMTTEPIFDDDYNEVDTTIDIENIAPADQMCDINYKKAGKSAASRRYAYNQNMVDNHRNRATRIENPAPILNNPNTTTDSRHTSFIRHKKPSDLNPVPEYMPLVIKMLENVLRSKPHNKINITTEDSESPRKKPVFWIAKWVDFEHKYGFGYTLSEGHYGVNFNDLERIVMNANGVNFVHIMQNETEYHYSQHDTGQWPSQDRNAMKKITLLSHIVRYMNKQLQHAGGNVRSPSDDFARIPYLSLWRRMSANRERDIKQKIRPNNMLTNFSDNETANSKGSENSNAKKRHQSDTDDISCFCFLLTNGTFQCNFSDSHVKVIICPLMEAVTFLNFRLKDGEDMTNRTFCLNAIMEHGCRREVYDYLKLSYISAKRVYEQWQAYLAGKKIPHVF